MVFACSGSGGCTSLSLWVGRAFLSQLRQIEELRQEAQKQLDEAKAAGAEEMRKAKELREQAGDAGGVSCSQGFSKGGTPCNGHIGHMCRGLLKVTFGDG